MVPYAALLLAAAVSTAAPPQNPARGVQAVSLATVEILTAGRGTIEPGPLEPRRQVRRNAAGQTTVEFE